MAVVTVSRGSASGGQLLAEGLADRLGYDILSREDIVQEAAKYGVPAEKLQEALLGPTSFWERFKSERRQYMAFVRAALCERARRDRVIYHGNAGHLLLSGVSHVVKIRLIAPAPFRIRMLMERRKIGHEEAIAAIEDVDRQRQQWTRFLYGVDWNDPNLYDVTVNLQTLGLESAVEVAASVVLRPEFAPTPQSLEAMAGLVLASRVQAALAADPETSSADVEVTASGDVVYLKGKLRPPDLVESVMRKAGEVEGVRRVDRTNLGAPDYTV